MALKLNNRKSCKIYLVLIVVNIILISVLVSFASIFNLYPTISLKYITYILSGFYIASLIYLFLQSTILDYDTTSEVVSIKTQSPLINTTVNNKDFFELPKDNIISANINNILIKKYLIIKFKNSEGKILKKYFDISTCFHQELKQIESDLNNLIQRN